MQLSLFYDYQGILDSSSFHRKYDALFQSFDSRTPSISALKSNATSQDSDPANSRTQLSATTVPSATR